MATELDPEKIFGDRRLAVEEVAKLMGVKVSTVRKWIRDGDMRALKLGKGYQVWLSAVRDFKKAKEDEIAEEAVRRQRDRQRRDELERRRASEPLLGWSLVNCFGCGLTDVYVTRHQREDGDVFCTTCRERVPEGNEIRLWTKDAIERIQAQRVRERNADAVATGSSADWTIFRCPVCQRPRALNGRRVLEAAYYFQCDHALPFHGTSQAKVDGGWDNRVIAALAQLEAQTRSSLGDAKASSKWSVVVCIACGRRQAVSKLEDVLVGLPCCRLCSRDRRPAAPEHRAGSIARHLRGASSRRCSCGGFEIIQYEPLDGVQGRLRSRPILSWCSMRPDDEKRALAEAYADRVHISSAKRFFLVSSVSTVDDDLQDLPF